MTADPTLSRRAWIASIASAMLAGCGRSGCGDRRPPDGSEHDTSSSLELRELDFANTPVGPQKAVVIVPKWGGAQERFPLLIALHGRGEANHGLSVGAWGWVKDYWLDRAIVRARKPPLDAAALLGITDAVQLERLNAELAARPLRGLVIACPYTTDIIGSKDVSGALPFAEFLERHLVPSVRSSAPVLQERGATGIDGVSLGGRMALLAGFAKPALFGAIGTLQAAVRSDEPAVFAELATAAAAKAGKPWPIRLLTSRDDPFRPALRALSEQMRRRGVECTCDVVAGPHDYAFNRGPGAYEMLLWHDRILRGEPPLPIPAPSG